MKNKLRQLIARLEQVRFFGAIAKGVRTCWTRLFHHFGLKLLSLLIAILLWNFVITTNSSITRTKTITDLTGYISGQSVLSASYGLALLDDPAEMLSDISVLVEVSQSEFARVSSDNVQVTLDLSSVRRAGTQEVALKAATSYGRVVQIMPDSLTLTFETLDSRVIPVNVQMVGAAEGDRWYNVNRSNPSALTIKGAASVVQSIVSAYVYIDITSARTPFTVAERYVLLDSEGNEIPQTMLDRSSSSISVSMDVYPTKEIPISTELANVVTGQPAEGYVVESVSIQPNMLTVVAEQELLDSITELHIDPISVDGLSQSFAARAKVSTLSSFKSISAEEVYVNVAIAEETVSAWVDGVGVTYVNKGEGLSIREADSKIRVYITGPKSDIEHLQEAGFMATADLSGLREGVHSVGLSFPVSTYPDVTFTPEQSEVQIELAQ